MEPPALELTCWNSSLAAADMGDGAPPQAAPAKLGSDAYDLNKDSRAREPFGARA